jgi:hypothetical protein
MGNIASWHEQLSNRALRGLTLDKLLNGQIVPFLRQMKFSATESGITRYTCSHTHSPLQSPVF